MAEPPARLIGEEQVVEAADLIIANTADEGRQLVDLYDAEPGRVRVIRPGVDLDVFTPGDREQARAASGHRARRARRDVRRPDPAVEGAQTS
ncbi:MAG: glycosyltransferase [Nocardioidaceae bacterium]